MDGDRRSPREAIDDLEERYAPEATRPLRGYVVTLATYATLVGGLATWVSGRGGPPQQLGTRDLVLAAVGTFRAARLITEASVTAPLRAPVTRYAGRGAPGEVREQVQDPTGGHRHALGELVSCPYCFGTWTATGFGFGLVLAPRWTRLAMSILSVEAAADVMQKLYSDLQAR